MSTSAPRSHDSDQKSLAMDSDLENDLVVSSEDESYDDIRVEDEDWEISERGAFPRNLN